MAGAWLIEYLEKAFRIGPDNQWRGAGMRDKDVARCMDSALGTAAWEGDNETVRALPDAGADVHAGADAPLRDAAMSGHAHTNAPPHFAECCDSCQTGLVGSILQIGLPW